MYKIVPDLAKINKFVDAAIPSARQMYDRFGFSDRRPSRDDDSETVDYNGSSKLDQMSAYGDYIENRQRLGDPDAEQSE